MKITEELKPKKHGARWTADDFRYLSELWYENISIKEIGETLERTAFAIICQLPWKLSVPLSRVLEQIEDPELKSKVIGLYVSDYMELVDTQVDKEEIKKAQKARQEERKARDERIEKRLNEVQVKYITEHESGLEELVATVFSSSRKKSFTILEIKERLVWIASLCLLFPAEDYDILFTVYPDDGTKKKTYAEAS